MLTQTCIVWGDKAKPPGLPAELGGFAEAMVSASAIDGGNLHRW